MASSDEEASPGGSPYGSPPDSPTGIMRGLQAAQDGHGQHESANHASPSAHPPRPLMPLDRLLMTERARVRGSMIATWLDRLFDIFNFLHSCS